MSKSWLLIGLSKQKSSFLEIPAKNHGEIILISSPSLNVYASPSSQTMNKKAFDRIKHKKIHFYSVL